jgi:Mg2+/citrate symporter
VIILGTILLVLAAIVILGTVFTNGTDAPDLSVLGISISNVSVGGLFLAGVITGAVAMFALSLLLGGGARKRHKAVERKREVKGARTQAESLEQENARLRDELQTKQTIVTDEPGGLRR